MLHILNSIMVLFKRCCHFHDELNFQCRFIRDYVTCSPVNDYGQNGRDTIAVRSGRIIVVSSSCRLHVANSVTSTPVDHRGFASWLWPSINIYWDNTGQRTISCQTLAVLWQWFGHQYTLLQPRSNIRCRRSPDARCVHTGSTMAYVTWQDTW